MAFITINGQEFPAPDNVWELITYTKCSGRVHRRQSWARSVQGQ